MCLSPPPSRESGNVLFIILLAVVLIGLLTAAISGSNDSESANIDDETLVIRVSEVKRYGVELERAVKYIMQDGHSEADIRFAHPDADAAYGDITDTPSRQVFAVEGGGATYRTPPADIQASATDWIFTGANDIEGVGTRPSITNEPQGSELIALLMNVSKDFCIAINKTNNIDNPPQDDGRVDYTNLFDGNFSYKRQIGSASEPTNNLEACFEGNTDPAAGTYHYYRVLLTR